MKQSNKVITCLYGNGPKLILGHGPKISNEEPEIV